MNVTFGGRVRARAVRLTKRAIPRTPDQVDERVRVLLVRHVPAPRHHRQPGAGQRGGQSPACFASGTMESSSPWTMRTLAPPRATRPASRRRPSPRDRRRYRHPRRREPPVWIRSPRRRSRPRARGDDHPRHAVVPSPDARRPAVAVRPREVREQLRGGRATDRFGRPRRQNVALRTNTRRTIFKTERPRAPTPPSETDRRRRSTAAALSRVGAFASPVVVAVVRAYQRGGDEDDVVHVPAPAAVAAAIPPIECPTTTSRGRGESPPGVPRSRVRRARPATGAPAPRRPASSARSPRWRPGRTTSSSSAAT